MKYLVFGGSMAFAMVAGALMVHCGNNSAGGGPLGDEFDSGGVTFAPDSGTDATTVNQRDGGHGKKDSGGGSSSGGSTLGKACSSASDCSDPSAEACCIYASRGPGAGVCTLRSECGPSGSGLPAGSGANGAPATGNSGAQLCTSAVPCSGNAKCSAETCESPNVTICSGSDFCSGSSCSSGDQCASGQCVKGKCISGTCNSNCPPGAPCKTANQCESDICVNDVCGASCTSDCPGGDPCMTNSQCASGDCQSGICTTSCTTDCPDGNPCSADSQCASGVCTKGKCAPPACAPNCSDGNGCGANSDCKSGICSDWKCVASCSPTCTQGQPCAKGGDCYSFICTDGKCAPPFCSPNCSAGSQCGANTDCTPPDFCANGKCEAMVTGCENPDSGAKGCAALTNTVGSFTCVELVSPFCGQSFNCSCLKAGQPCSECPVTCEPGKSGQCTEEKYYDASVPATCCSLGPDAGGVCQINLTDMTDSGMKVDIDAKSVTTSCPATCDPCGGNSCKNNELCCPLIQGNKHAGACVPGPAPCPLPQIPPPPPPRDAGADADGGDADSGGC